ncbi:tetratricopeptide repeat protein [Anthocerotibacter panamensis]|uniref:tetratricopeptide repeat protein n=1 Tax=Anthocerotibacter panamensis TaxID=2857077 RepID=UPI001C402E8F|nr:hypothetical protein [Anthocerotibacter panamensis]
MAVSGLSPGRIKWGRLVSWGLLLLWAGGIVLGQWPRADLSGRSQETLTAPPVLPRPEVARYLTFGFGELWADWYWLRFVQYFGDLPARHLTGYNYSADYLELVTTLDPQFVGAYTAAAFAIAEAQADPDRALVLMRRGLAYNRGKNLPYLWNLYQRYAGTLFLFKKDYRTAARYFEEAVRQPGAPPVLRSFAAAFYRASNDWERAIPLWADSYLTSPYPDLKTRARRQLERMGVWLDAWGPRPQNLQPAADLLQDLHLACPAQPIPEQRFGSMRATYIPLALLRARCRPT